MRIHSPVLALATAPLLVLTACGGDAGSATGTQVVASSYPFAYVAAQVGGDAVDVENLTSPGVEPHDVELAPKQIASIQDADLAIFESGFQPAVDDAVEEADLDDDSRLDVADVVTLREADEAHGHEHEHEGEDGHDHGGLDPHVWLDPTNMIAIADATAERLAQADSDHADTFERNARAFTRQLRELDRAYETRLANCERTTIVTSHEAFGYLTGRYGLEQVGIAGLDPSSEPSPEQLADITDLVREDGITTIFTEELVSPAVAETVAEETGADVATLDPIEGLNDDTEDETYVTLMERNLAALEEANGC